MKIDFYDFSEDQIEHAEKVLKGLFSKRYFPYRAKHSRDRGYERNAELFSWIIEQTDSLKSDEGLIRSTMAGEISRLAQKFELSDFDARDNSVVDFRVLSAGAEICTAWPLAKFRQFLPEDYSVLRDEIIDDWLTNPSSQDIRMRTDLLVDQFKELEIEDPCNNRVVVLFRPIGKIKSDSDVARFVSAVAGLKRSGEALGYLMYKASCAQPLLRNRRDPSFITGCKAGDIWFRHESLSLVPQFCSGFRWSKDLSLNLHFAAVF